MNNKKLVLETGEVFLGKGFGANTERVAELVYNTAVVGYQEAFSDPSNLEYIMVMGYPVIGSYGLTDEDYESNELTISGLVVREYSKYPSNFRYTHELDERMDENGVPGISGLDTRELVRIINEKGSMRAMIANIDTPTEECLKKIKEYSVPKDVVAKISTKKVWYSRTVNYKYTIACIDLGLKKSLIAMLKDLGCNVVVLPYNANIEQILKYKPNGLFISDGPSNPYDIDNVIETINTLKGKMPILGVGLGQEIIELAYGAKLYKQKVGHNGCNIPVRNLKTNKIEITSQNDQYAVDVESLKKTELKPTHQNVIDGIITGVEDSKNKVIAVQFNPAPTSDDEYVFKRFINLIGGKKNA
ncbi:MAG: carbamoyl phosphate synthase small subunit [Acholeplasmatales bacterium]|nr:carbamoyl phosphate synthase small subunit [Acholeplasmatales bacterium]